MNRTIFLISTLSKEPGYPKIYYGNGCNYAAEELIDQFLELDTLEEWIALLEKWKMKVIDEKWDLEFLIGIDDFVQVGFNPDNTNPTIKKMIYLNSQEKI